MSNYYKKKTVIRRTTTVTLTGGGTMTETSLYVLLQEVGIDVNPTWREDSTRNLDRAAVEEINAEMMRLGSLIDIKA